MLLQPPYWRSSGFAAKGNIVTSFATGSTNTPFGLAYDPVSGNMVDDSLNMDTIYVHNGLTSSIIDSWGFTYNSNNGLGMTADGDLLSCGGSVSKNYRYVGVSNTVRYSLFYPSGESYAPEHIAERNGLPVLACNQSSPLQYRVHQCSSWAVGAATPIQTLTQTGQHCYGMDWDANLGNLIICEYGVSGDVRIQIMDGFSLTPLKETSYNLPSNIANLTCMPGTPYIGVLAYGVDTIYILE